MQQVGRAQDQQRGGQVAELEQGCWGQGAGQPGRSQLGDVQGQGAAAFDRGQGGAGRSGGDGDGDGGEDAGK